MPSSLFLGWICEAINQSSLSKENPIKMKKASIWQTFLASFQLSVQLNFCGTHGVIYISFLFRGSLHGFWPVLRYICLLILQKISLESLLYAMAFLGYSV